MARVDITPPLGIRMRNWGYGDADIAVSVHRPLTLTALAFDGPDGFAAQLLITADLGWWRTKADEAQVRGAVLAATELPIDHVLIALTHTHAGPSICADDLDLPGGEGVPEYLDQLSTAAVTAAKQAISELSPGIVDWAKGSHALAAVRDVTIAGRALLAFDPSQDADDTLLVGRISNPDGSLRAIVANYACHPTSLGWANDAISPDYPGAMRELVETTLDTTCLFFQGASGELAPRVQYGSDLELTDTYGRGLGNAVLATLSLMPSPGTGTEFTRVVESGAPLGMWEEAPYLPDPTRSIRHREVPVEIKELAPISELERQWSHIDARARTERMRRATRLRQSYTNMSAPTHPLWVWRLGGLLIVAHPGEAYSALQTSLRARFPDQAIMVLNLVNGPGWIYLPPRAAYDDERYQSWQTLVRPGALEAVIEAAAELVEEMLP